MEYNHCCTIFLGYMMICIGQGELVYTNNFTFEINSDNDLIFIKETALEKDIHMIEKILPKLYVFEHRGLPAATPVDEEFIIKLKDIFLGKVALIEQVTEDYETEPVGAPRSSRSIRDVLYYDDGSYSYPDNTCYEMGIEDAWTLGHLGEGVVIAVLDVGVDKNIPDLKDKINQKLSYNFVHDNPNFAPEIFPDYPVESLSLTDHGNRCTGLIAAVRKNGICGSGVAYGSTIAALKVFEVEFKKFQFVRRFNPVMTTKALSFNNDKIHIYSNSWGPTEHFKQINRAPLQAIENGALQGRDNKGSIYVFPSGPLADAFANSVYTIAVNSVGVGGTIPTFAKPCACVLTSVYGVGNTFKSTYLITTSHGPGNCTREFTGVSASTALASGIIALALQKRPDLSWRDVQYLVISASEHSNLADTDTFRRNGAGKYYHNVLGFGLLNASKLVALAENWKPVPAQAQYSSEKIVMRSKEQRSMSGSREQVAEVKVECTAQMCLKTVEHVVVTISFKTYFENETELVLVSPMNTASNIMSHNQSNMTSTKRDNVDLLSVHFWGEDPNGVWTISLRYYGKDEGKLEKSFLSLTLFGVAKSEQYQNAENINDRQIKRKEGDNEASQRPATKRVDYSEKIYIVMLPIVCLLILFFPCGYMIYLVIQTHLSN